MLITYFDEVKYQANVQAYQWLAGIAVPGDILGDVEDELNILAMTAFGRSSLERTTEFHASAIMNGSGPFAGVSLTDRLDVLKELARILSRFKRQVRRIVVSIDVSQLYSATWTPAELAFIFFIERVNALARAEKCSTLLIGDYEHRSLVNAMVERFADYRSVGTPFPYGIRVEHVVDTVHFAQSHHSRMLQLADAWAWFCQLPHAPRSDREPRRSLIRFLRADAGIMWPDKYKIWPQNAA